jgi:hypothetical protein
VIARELCLSPASDADGADGVSGARMDSDDPAAGVALTAKGDLDAERPQGGLRPPQAAGERPGNSGSAGALPPNSVPCTAAVGTGPQQVGGSASMASSIAPLRLAA